VLHHRAPLLLHDILGDSELLARPSITALSLRSALCVPLQRGEALYGVLYADSSAGAASFDNVDLEVLRTFAEFSTALLESHRLLEDVRRSYTELKATQDRMLRSERLRVIGEVASGVAHEFNNLLTAILARVQLIGLSYVQPELRDHLEVIERAVMDAAGIVRRLQTISRARREEGFQSIDLHDILADAVEFLRPLWATRRKHGRPPIAVRVRATRGHVVYGSAPELREVVTNLLKNAIEALDLGGSIDLHLARNSGRVRLQIRDDGPGIAPEVKAQLFTPFFTTKGERGTGLGLCLCQEIVERHGGELVITSAPGQGTEVAVELPVQDVNASVGIARPPPGGLESRRRLSVMVVDDDRDVREPLCAYLQRMGHSVRSAAGGVDALAQLAASPSDVVVSDVAMPGLDGLQLCARLRSEHPGLPVVLVSGTASHVEPELLTEAGAAALLAKPFTMRQIEDLLFSLTERRAKLRT
jgi:signal transduction histidine kinase/ActR/RegA family two-component response regulator